MTTELRSSLRARYRTVRAATEALAAPLSPEDQQLQSMPECSPTKWHRAHTTWFFETFLLLPAGFSKVEASYAYLFNSYYEAVGPRHARPHRGLISRPGAAEVADYRRIVDERMDALLTRTDDAELAALRPVLELGLAHEEQHQELLLTDILHAFSQNPTQPVYRADADGPRAAAVSALTYTAFAGGLNWVGVEPGETFAFDNEGPRHQVWLEPFGLADRLITVGEVKAFICAGGYDTPSLWLSAGMDFIRANQVTCPGYASWADGVYTVFGLGGVRVPDDDEPAGHLSFYEADALCQFLGGRLPTEAEWEVAARGVTGLRQLYGHVWQWTRSAYGPFPGFRPGSGAVGEYNGKFMANQMVLRGGSCLTPSGHIRATYRNFWPADTRFQVTGARLARDL